MDGGGRSAGFYDIVASSGAYKFYLDGRWQESASGKTVPVINPCTREPQYHMQGALAFVVGRVCVLGLGMVGGSCSLFRPTSTLA